MKKSFSRRKATSFGLFLSFVILLVSGAILYVFPGGNGSGLLSEFGGLTKPAWLNQHIVFGIAFTLLSLYHLLFINREPFLTYLKKKKNEGRQSQAELLTTIVVTSLIAIGTYIHMQPFSALLNTGKEIAGTPEQKNDDRTALQDNATADAERSRRHDFDDRYDDRQASPRLASRWEDSEETTAARFNSGTDDNESQSANNGAPDDDLHRRTKASCASCH
jgi:hypothetical protein